MVSGTLIKQFTKPFSWPDELPCREGHSILPKICPASEKTSHPLTSKAGIAMLCHRVEKDTFEMYPDKIQIHESVSLVSSDTDTLPTHPCDFSIAWTSFSETIYNFQEHSRWAGNCTYIRHCMSPLRRSGLARGRLRSIFLYLYRWFLQLGRLVHGLIDHFLADVKLNWSTSPAG